jgi:hypothetical protein
MFRLMIKAVFIMILALAGFFFETTAMNPYQISSDSTWHKLGVTTVNFQEEKSEILILETEKYGYIRFKSTEFPVDLSDVEIFYETGTNQHIRIDILLEPHEESQAIEIMGGERRLLKVAFKYKSPSVSNSRANIELWGLIKKDK